MDYSRKKKKKKYSPGQVLQKMMHYCSYQERCHHEVRYKILDYEVYGDDLEYIISELVEQNFLNEERFARAYVRGKFKMKSWGKNKIIQGLRQRKISDYCIRKGLEEITELNYDQTLLSILEKKKKTLVKSNSFELRQKLFRFAIQKGYHATDINRVISRLVD